MGQLGTLRVFIAAFALVFAGLHLRQTVLDPNFGRDFTQHYISGRALLDGRTDLIYDTTSAYQDYADRIGVLRPVEDEHAKTHWVNGVPPPVVVMVHGYPPPVVLLTAPLALLPYTAARLVWYWMGVFAMAGAVWFLFRNRPREERREQIGAGLVATALFFPLYPSLSLGQINTVLLLLLVAALDMVRRKRDWAAGALIGMAGMIKIFPFIIVLWFLSTRRYRAAGAAVVASVVIIGVSLLAVDWRVQSDYFFGTLPSQSGLHVAGSQGFFGLFSRWLGTDMPGLAKTLAALVSLGFLLASCLAAQRYARIDPLAMELSFALFLVLAILASPKSWDHDGLFLLPANLLFFEVVAHRVVAQARALTWVVAMTYAVWASVLTTSAEVALALRCLSMVSLWVCLMLTLKRMRQ